MKRLALLILTLSTSACWDGGIFSTEPRKAHVEDCKVTQLILVKYPSGQVDTGKVYNVNGYCAIPKRTP